MTRGFSWNDPKDPQEAPRGADVLQRGLTRITNVAAQEVVDLRRRAEQAHAADLLRDEVAIVLAIADLSELIGAFYEATDAAQQAAALARRIDDSDLELDALNTVAVVRGRLGQLDDALELQEDVRLRRAEGPRVRGAVATLINTAVLAAAGDRNTSLDLLDDAFRLARQGDDPYSSGQVLNNVGVLLTEQKCFDEAERLLQRAVILRQRSGDRRGLGHTYNNVGIVHRYLGDLVGAIPFLEMATVLLADVGDLPGLLIALSNNVVVFEHQYLEPARRLRSSFAQAVDALSAHLPSRVADANVVNVHAMTTEFADDDSKPESASWGVIPQGASLFSTQLTATRPPPSEGIPASGLETT